MGKIIARGRCEVSGKVYLPGDEVTADPAQLAFLKKNNAVIEVATPAPVLEKEPPPPEQETVMEKIAETVQSVFPQIAGKRTRKGRDK